MQDHIGDEKPTKLEGGATTCRPINLPIVVHPQLVERIRSILKMMQETFAVWDEQCEVAFVDVKKILASPSAVARIVQGNKL